MKLIIKFSNQLNKIEIAQINAMNYREFKCPSLNNKTDNMVHFLLFENQMLLAKGEVVPIENIQFNGEKYSILGVGGIIANIKGKGYGKKIISAIKKYLRSKSKTGVGFCRSHNKRFYLKCGFEVDDNSIKRFIYCAGGKEIINTEDHCVIFLDSKDRFMQNVLLTTDKKVILPRPPNW